MTNTKSGGHLKPSKEKRNKEQFFCDCNMYETNYYFVVPVVARIKGDILGYCVHTLSCGAHQRVYIWLWCQGSQTVMP